MSDIKTGNKGFVVDGQVYHIDQVPVGEDGVNILENLKSIDPGSINVDNTVKDIGNKTRLTLGTYLSKATKGEVGSTSVSNKYTIDAPTESTQTSKIIEGGYPAPISPTTNSSKFAGNLPSSVSDNFVKATNTLNNVTTIVGKGKSQESSTKNILDGNELLPGVVKNNANVVTLQPALKAYTVAATSPEYRTSFVSLGDFQSPPKGLNVSLLKVKSLNIDGIIDPSESYISYGGLGNDSEVVKPAFLGLGLKIAIQKSKKITENNPYPVSITDEFNVANLFSITSTDGKYPTSLTTPSNQNSSVFANPIKDSYTSYYVNLNVNADKGLQKGKTANANSPSGHTFLSNVVLSGNSIDETKAVPLYGYTDSVIGSNTFTSEPQKSFVDLGSVSSKFVPLINSVKVFGKYRGQLGDTVEFFPLTLSQEISKPAEITEGNKFPVKTKPDNPEIVSLSVNERPSPLSSAESQNEDSTFAGTLDSSFTKNYPVISGKFQKGKSFDKPDNPDGNDLLPSAAEKAPPGGSYVKNATNLNDPILTYTQTVVGDNTFKDAVGSLQSNKFLDSSVDASAPPPNFEPEINDIDPSEQKGMYTGAKKNPITFQSLQQKAIDVTAGNEYKLDTTLDQLSSTTDPVTGLPSPLTSTNTNSYVASNQIKPESKDPSIENFSIGKESKGQGKINGNTLLFGVSGNLNVTGVGSRTKEGLPVSPSATGIAQSNPLYNYTGGRGTPVLSVGQNRWTAESRSFTSGVDGYTKLVLPDGKEVDQLKMANIGAGLMLRASGEIPAWYADKFNPNDSESSAGAILPSVVQAGVLKVNNLKLTALDVFNHLKDDATFNPDSLTSIAPFDGQSWGSTNNPEEMFDDTSGVGSSITMLAMIIAISGLFTLIGNANNGAGRQTKTLGGQMSLGKYKFSPDSSEKVLSYFNADEILGLLATNNNYEDCLATGSKAFFLGAGKADISFGEVALATTGIGLDSIVGDASAVGANLTVCRTIVRSGLMIAQQTETIIKRFKSNPVSGSKAFLGVFKIIRSSKIMRAINTFASLGDALIDRQNGAIPGPDGRPIEIGKNGFESVDPSLFSGDKKTINGLQQTHTKSRLTYKDKYDPALSWGAARAPAMYLTDPSIEGLSLLDSDGNLGSFKGKFGLKYKTAGGNDQPSYHQSGGNGRISNDDKDRMERILDSEYVPFYFHDVRTNEIVSFHAFLASISDDYSVNYESSEGIGRIEPVKIYKGTTRKIGMSFYVAATSEDDFDHMWFKINKLTTLIYPQYTRGRDLLPSDGTNQYRFTAPFSQIPGASPLIRIRLGDLFRSNYSKFALARLFGAGRKASGNNQMSLPDSSGKSIQIDTSTYSLQDWLANLPKDTELDVDPIKNYLNKVNPKINTTDVKSVKVVGSTDKGQTYTIAYTNTTPGVNPKDVTGIPSNVVYPTQEEINKKLNQINTASGDAARGALTDFLKSEKNAIVKSFESAGGKGLAGVIESMNFDWYDKVTWETNPGQTAPKLCKVTISFSPIHDISPGIDHAGYNRAPIYPVGRGMAPSKIKF